MRGSRRKALRREVIVGSGYDPKTDGKIDSWYKDKDIRRLVRSRKKNYLRNRQPWHSVHVESEVMEKVSNEVRPKRMFSTKRNLSEYFQSTRNYFKNDRGTSVGWSRRLMTDKLFCQLFFFLYIFARKHITCKKSVVAIAIRFFWRQISGTAWSGRSAIIARHTQRLK